MNVYVRELVSALAQGGVDCTTFTRADRPGLPEVVQVEPGHRVVHVPAGPFDLRKEQLPGVIDEFSDRVCRAPRRRLPRRRAPRQLLAERAGRPPAQARARPAVRQHVPHARQGQGRGRRPRAGVARAGRGRDHRLRRRDLRQLHRGGAPVPPPLRRPGRAHRGGRARRRARVLRTGRSRRCAPRARPADRRAGAAVRRPHPAAEGSRRRRPRARRAAPARCAAARRRRRERARGRRRGRASSTS